MKKIVFIGLGVVVLLMIVFGVLAFININEATQKILSEEIKDISFQEVNDGVYRGAFYSGDLGITVIVTVDNGEIINIDYENHLNGKGTPAESIKEGIIEEQSIIIDDISGATISSRCIKLAIMNAFEGE